MAERSKACDSRSSGVLHRAGSSPAGATFLLEAPPYLYEKHLLVVKLSWRVPKKVGF